MTNVLIQRSVSAIGMISLLGTLFFLESSLGFIMLICSLLIVCVCKEIPSLSYSVIEYICLLILVGIALIILAVWYAHPLNRWKTFYCIGCAFMHDTAAYLGGSLFGRHALFPKTSPNKTWEGLLSGSIALLLAHYSYSRYVYYPQWYWHAISASCIANIGDWAESFLKRRAGLKDSGSLIAGHGGVLDRLDSIIALVYWCIFL